MQSVNSFIHNTIAMLFVIAPLLFVTLYCCYVWYKNRGLPPGPWGLPIFGYTPFLSDFSHEDATELARRYGDILCINIGWPLIYLNSLEMVKKVFVNGSDTFAYRPRGGFQAFINPKRLGITGSDGPAWLEQRRFALRTLHDFGVGKQLMEHVITDEALYLCDQLRKCDQLVCPNAIISKAVSNVICHLILGHRPGYDDPEFENYINAIAENLQAGVSKRPAIPTWLVRLSIVRKLAGVDKLVANGKAITEYISSNVAARKAVFDEDAEPQNFIDSFLLEKARLDKSGSKHAFTEEQLVRVVVELFFAGVDTTTCTLCWAVLLIAMYPEVQQRMYDELERTLGQRQPSMKDLRSMPFAEAVICEIQRYQTVAASSLPHTATGEAHIEGYRVPENAVVFANIWAVHHDEHLWKDPNAFNPDNFLDNAGALVNVEQLITFSLGARECPGKSLARVEVFIFLATILQHFVLTFDVSAQGFTVDQLMRGVGSGTRSPLSYLIKWRSRNV